jgi:DNA-binding protein WhiA
LFTNANEKECCFKSFLRGLFISSGSCTVPNFNEKGTTGYHLELAFSHTAPASEMVGKLLSFGIEAKATRRKDSIIVYVKNSESIKNFFALIGASVSVLKMTDLMISRELSNNSNRQTNCDLGNVSRQIEAFEKQLSAIEKIKKTIGIDGLKKDLQETAKARIENPEETLLELAKKLGVTKSCLNHRLRKIVALANEL